jgi:2'-5' RNA ligase
MESCARELCAKHGLRRAPIPAERLHVTLCFLGDFDGIPRQVADRSRDCAGAVRGGPFAIEFDLAETLYDKRKERCPLVLGAAAPHAGVQAFQAGLQAALASAGLRQEKRPFKLHLTVLYDENQVMRTPIRPIRWNATELLLMHSWVGQGRHEVLGTWPLPGV